MMAEMRRKQEDSIVWASKEKSFFQSRLAQTVHKDPFLEDLNSCFFSLAFALLSLAAINAGINVWFELGYALSDERFCCKF